jgi:hypothetical protein
VMDLYGGAQARFHLNCMRGTPKNSEMLDCFITTASLALKHMIRDLDVRYLVDEDEIIAEWLRCKDATAASRSRICKRHSDCVGIDCG